MALHLKCASGSITACVWKMYLKYYAFAKDMYVL
jgi:hypothetical protein